MRLVTLSILAYSLFRLTKQSTNLPLQTLNYIIAKQHQATPVIERTETHLIILFYSFLSRIRTIPFPSSRIRKPVNPCPLLVQRGNEAMIFLLTIVTREKANRLVFIFFGFVCVDGKARS